MTRGDQPGPVPGPLPATSHRVPRGTGAVGTAVPGAAGAPGNRLLAVVALSASLGLLGGAGAAWAIYHRLGPAERVVEAPAQLGGTQSGTTAPSVASVARDAGPSVVKIVTRPLTGADLQAEPAGLVTGFIASSDGLVVTSAHALEGATRLRVVTADGHAYEATVAATDTAHGLALLRAVGASGLTPLRFARTDPGAGDLAVAVGAPPFATVSITSGSVSSTGRTLRRAAGAPPVLDVLSVDAVPKAEDDGAPLLDGTGAVVGVVDGGPHADLPGLVALSGRDASSLVQRATSGTAASRGSFGVEAVILDPATATAAGVPRGALIRAVTAGGPAALAGLAPGDIVTAVNGTPVDAQHSLDPADYNLDPSQTVTFTVQRGTAQRSVRIAPAAG